MDMDMDILKMDIWSILKSESRNKSMFKRFFEKFPLKNEHSPEDIGTQACEQNLACSNRKNEIFREETHESDGDEAKNFPGKRKISIKTDNLSIRR